MDAAALAPAAAVANTDFVSFVSTGATPYFDVFTSSPASSRFGKCEEEENERSSQFLMMARKPLPGRLAVGALIRPPKRR